MLSHLPQTTGLKRVLILIGCLYLTAGPIASVFLIPRGFSQFVGLNDRAVAAAIADATVTAQAELDPITCNGAVISPGAICSPGRGIPGGFMYDGRLKAEQAAKQRAEQRALDDIYNARHPVPSHLVGLALLCLGLLTGAPTVLWYRRAYLRAKEERAWHGAM